jgi:hypothetical protein
VADALGNIFELAAGGINDLPVRIEDRKAAAAACERAEAGSTNAEGGNGLLTLLKLR